ncbi:MAG TPA: hypothetical protein VM734_11220 [Kofleriaceae bacterium]|nr:hypothetical protein [Kofleriaceae bacterium]
MQQDSRQLEMSKELTTARRALLAVGIIMFIMDMLVVHALQKDQLAPSDRNLISLLSLFVLGIFVGLYFFAKTRPRIALTLGLVIFWGIQIFNITQDPKAITQGIVLKIFFTLALVKGLKSAGRAEELKRQLGHVFE